MAKTIDPYEEEAAASYDHHYHGRSDAHKLAVESQSVSKSSTIYYSILAAVLLVAAGFGFYHTKVKPFLDMGKDDNAPDNVQVISTPTQMPESEAFKTTDAQVVALEK